MSPHRVVGRDDDYKVLRKYLTLLTAVLTADGSDLHIRLSGGLGFSFEIYTPKDDYPK